MKNYKTASEYISANKQWGSALKKLRIIILTTELKETIKLDVPVCTLDDKNIVGLGAFKSYVSLWFFQGVLLKDRGKRLVNTQEGVTKVLRQLRFNSAEEINDKLVLEYVKESIKTGNGEKD